MPDLFLICVDPQDSSRRTYQIWRNDKAAGFTLAREGRLPAGVGQVAFADMDRDGTLDMVFPTCVGSRCALNIAYNLQMPLCSRGDKLGTRCRDAGALCVADPEFRFDLDPSPSNAAFSQIPLGDLVSFAPIFVLEDVSFRGKLPNPVRVGDYNQDGYPDVLIVSADRIGASQGRVTLLESRPCDRLSCSPEEVAAGRRAFRAVVTGADALSMITDARSASFIDIDEEVRRSELLCVDLVGLARHPRSARRNGRRLASADVLQEQLLPRRVLSQGSRAQRRLRDDLRAGRLESAAIPGPSNGRVVRPDAAALRRQLYRRDVQIHRARSVGRAQSDSGSVGRICVRADLDSRAAAADVLHEPADALLVHRPRPDQQLHRVAVHRLDATSVPPLCRHRGRDPEQSGRHPALAAFWRHRSRHVVAPALSASGRLECVGVFEAI